MISYDIKGLLIIIPVVKVIEICLKVLYYSGLKHPQLCKEMLHMAVEFSFDGKMYKQIDGVAMGSR